MNPNIMRSKLRCMDTPINIEGMPLTPLSKAMHTYCKRRAYFRDGVHRGCGGRAHSQANEEGY